MNQITRAAAELSTGGTILGVMTVLFMLFFIGVAIRLLVRGEDTYKDAANLVVDDD